MFESRGIEYGWPPDIDPYAFDKAVLQSDIFKCVVGLLREDSPPEWKRETISILNRFYPGWFLGSPMQNAAMNLRMWRQRNLLGLMMKARYPLGIASGHIMYEDFKPELNTDWRRLMYKPASSYDTKIAQVTEQVVKQSDADMLLRILKRESGGEDFEDADEELKKDLAGLVDSLQLKRSLYAVLQWGWLPRSQHPEEMEARDYMEECERYQASEAGRRAKRLLIENLTDVQERDYFRLGYFFVVPDQPDKEMHERRIYVIERNFPNGNVMQVKLRRTRGKNFAWFPTKTFCYHTEEPHAIDDIVLGQKLVLEHDEEEFRENAHISGPPLRGQYALPSVKLGV